MLVKYSCRDSNRLSNSPLLPIPVIECTKKRVEAVDVVGDVDICEVAVDRRGRVGDFQPRLAAHCEIAASRARSCRTRHTASAMSTMTISAMPDTAGELIPASPNQP
jgi:hypothetical protein